MTTEPIDATPLDTPTGPDPLDQIFGAMPNRCVLSFTDAKKVEPEVLDETGMPAFRRLLACFNFAETGFGFGEFAIWINAEGQHFVDTECMSKERIKKYLGWLVDSAITDHEEDPARAALYAAEQENWHTPKEQTNDP